MSFASRGIAAPSGQYFNNENFHSNHPYVKDPGYYSDQESNNAAAKSIVHNDNAALLAAQIKSQYGTKVDVKASGSTVTISSPRGINEADWRRGTITLPVTATAPKFTKSVITMKNTDGDDVQLNDSADAATAKLDKDFCFSAKERRSDAIAKGASVYQFKLPALSGIDGVTAAFGADEDTTGRTKKVHSATLECGYGTSGMGESPYVPVYPIGL